MNDRKACTALLTSTLDRIPGPGPVVVAISQTYVLL